MLILTIHNLEETFTKENNDYYPEDYEYTTKIVVFTNHNNAINYIKKLKEEYHAKGKTNTGNLYGKKLIKDKLLNKKTKISIRTELKELDEGVELTVASESDIGECPFGN